MEVTGKARSLYPRKKKTAVPVKQKAGWAPDTQIRKRNETKIKETKTPINPKSPNSIKPKILV